MSTKAPAKAYPQVVKLEKALKLAEAWVDNMSRTAADESTELEFEGRPSRLGLGVKVIPQFKAAASTDPVERKLHAKLDAEKKRAAKNVEESNPAEKSDENSDGDDNDPESRTNAFVKKRSMFLATSFQAKKKHR
ncbi:uncharacterized protein LOC131231296 [Magnolia sinica]|uniref:uncharacterized protein LOC131231296 n=1 Tax=Magnolia sinica TaxID=86752 RepID=UPI00265AFD09|nr:uncharacterized protein LOC131231296 [Magnolia sinica]XP_058083425.1 uncharacterized protein LOC131231296 [Magnolia sinica]